MRKIINMLIFIIGLLSAVQLQALSPIVIKNIYECVELATKKSGKILSPTAKRAAVQSLKDATTKYGDDILKIANNGGIDAIELGVKYGDDFWRISKYSPNVAKSLLTNSDEMLKIAKKNGINFLKFETQHPGFSMQVIKTFGDDALKNLAVTSNDDLVKLLGYANKADSKQTKNLLYATYNKAKNKSAFLAALNWKNIMAVGLSSAAITAAYKTSNGIEVGLQTVATNSPETFMQSINFLFFILVAIACIILLPIIIKYYKLFRSK